MDDGRVSYEKAVEAIRRFGYAGVEREEDEVTLYADDVPYCSVKNVHYPLRVWDEEHCHWITIEDCRTLEDVIWHFNNGDCTLYEARAWCLVNNAPQYEFLRRISEPRPEFTGAYNTRPQEKEPWPYRLVAFLNRCLEILINSILEDFV